MITVVVAAVAAKINNKKVGTKLKLEAYFESSQTSTMELFLVKTANC